jgi:hypothetical protein
VHHPDRAREVGDEEQRALQRGDEHEVEPGVVGRDLGAELGDARLDLLAREVRLADAEVVAQRARSSLNRWARRSMSRR